MSVTFHEMFRSSKNSESSNWAKRSSPPPVRSDLVQLRSAWSAKVFMILSIFSSNLINYNHDVYQGIAWLSRRICRAGLSHENEEPTHEDDRDILLLGGEHVAVEMFEWMIHDKRLTTWSQTCALDFSEIFFFASFKNGESWCQDPFHVFPAKARRLSPHRFYADRRVWTPRTEAAAKAAGVVADGGKLGWEWLRSWQNHDNHVGHL